MEIAETTKQISNQTITILQKYISKISSMDDYLELDEIMIDMLEDLRCNSIYKKNLKITN